MTTTNPMPIFDGHNDTLLRLYKAGRENEQQFLTGSDAGHIDLPRARAGGFGGGFFAVYVPPAPGTARPEKEDLIVTADGYHVRMADAVDPTYAQGVAMGVSAVLF